MTEDSRKHRTIVNPMSKAEQEQTLSQTENSIMPALNVAIFVLDDHQHVLDLIDKVFQQKKIQNYHLFSDEIKFLKDLNEDVHIAVIDYMLKGEHTGLDVCKLLLQRNPQCHVIIMSAQSDFDIVIDFMNSGAWRYVAKQKGDYLNKIVEFVNEAYKNIEQDLDFFTKLLRKQSETEKFLGDAK